MVARRPGDRESAAACRLDRRTRGKQCGLVGRLRADRVGVEEAARRSNLFDERGGVAAQNVLDGGRPALDEGEALVQDGDALL
jgi:hypothetical protein